MESSGEGVGELGFREIEAVAATDGLSRSDVFHIVKEVLGFVLYMHHQIPAVLQHLEHEFDSLKKDYKDLDELIPAPALKASFQKKHNMRKREVKQGIKRLEKLMNYISNLLSAFQRALDETPDILGVSLVLGGSLVRPQHVYEVFFSHRRVDSGSIEDYAKTRVAEALSRKVIRALISNGAGSSSYSGPIKLFLLIKTPCSFNLPLCFLPKRDFRYSKKIVPFKLHIRCKISPRVVDNAYYTSETAGSTSILASKGNDVIWFQCKHTVRGLASRRTPVEE